MEIDFFRFLYIISVDLYMKKIMSWRIHPISVIYKIHSSFKLATTKNTLISDIVKDHLKLLYELTLLKVLSYSHAFNFILVHYSNILGNTRFFIGSPRLT